MNVKGRSDRSIQRRCLNQNFLRGRIRSNFPRFPRFEIQRFRLTDSQIQRLHLQPSTFNLQPFTFHLSPRLFNSALLSDKSALSETRNRHESSDFRIIKMYSLPPFSIASYYYLTLFRAQRRQARNIRGPYASLSTYIPRD